jgi:MFS family permease
MGCLQFWHIYIANCIGSIANAFQWVAFTSSVTLLIPKNQIAKFGGMNQAAPALSMLLAPLLAGLLVTNHGLRSVFAVEMSTFILASMVTLTVRIPKAPPSEEGQKGKGNVWDEIYGAWGYIKQRPGLVGLLFFLANGQFCSGLIQVLMTPL